MSVKFCSRYRYSTFCSCTAMNTERGNRTLPASSSLNMTWRKTKANLAKWTISSAVKQMSTLHSSVDCTRHFRNKTHTSFFGLHHHNEIMLKRTAKISTNEQCGDRNVPSYYEQNDRRFPFLHDLSPEQFAAATSSTECGTENRTVTRVLAGPGSGKTRVLTARAAFLVYCKGTSPDNVLCITFTNKAANEMKQRLEKIDETMRTFSCERSHDRDPMVSIRCGTFHSICLQILRQYQNTLPGIGITNGFSVCDSDDASAIMKNILIESRAIRKRDGDTEENDRDTKPGREEKENINIISDRILHYISLAKNLSRSSHNVPGSSMEKLLLEHGHIIPATQTKKSFSQLYDSYTNMKTTLNVVDFDDLLHKALAVVKFGSVKHENGDKTTVLRLLQKRWHHILVDEFQDTNSAQYSFLYELMHGDDSQILQQKDLFVVGDSDQSIFGWRGANMLNMSQFLLRDFYDRNVKTYKLETNYRSTSAIINAAKAVLPASSSLEPVSNYVSEMNIVSEVGDIGIPVRMFAANDEQHEAEMVCAEAARLVNHSKRSFHSDFNLAECEDKLHDKEISNLEWKDICILYRTKMQARAIEDACIKNEIPYHLLSGTPFFNRKEIRDLVSYLKLILNPGDDVAFNRVINCPPRGIGSKSLEKFAKYAQSKGQSLGECLGMNMMLGENNTHNYYDADDHYDGLGSSLLYDSILPSAKEIGLTKKSRNAILEFCQLIHQIRVFSLGSPNSEDIPNVHQILTMVIDKTRYREYLDNNNSITKKKVNASVEKLISDRLLNVNELLRIAKDAGASLSLSDFLESIAMYGAENDNNKGITTINSIADSNRADNDDPDDSENCVKLMTIHMAKGLEFAAVFLVGFEKGLLPLPSNIDEDEERRLLYVALTRAKNHLYITRATWRRIFGKRCYMRESPFAGSLLKASTNMGLGNRQYHEEEWVEL